MNSSGTIQTNIGFRFDEIRHAREFLVFLRQVCLAYYVWNRQMTLINSSVSWEPLMDSATLYNIYRDTSYSNQDNLIHKIDAVETVDLIVNSFDDGDHPFHLHGHEFFIVGVSYHLLLVDRSTCCKTQG